MGALGDDDVFPGFWAVSDVPMSIGDRARKIRGSYQADGTIVAAFETRSGLQRYVFEFDEPAGLLHIFGPQQLARIQGEARQGALL